jgi:thiol-disulfide isomerase/thioredoxin
MRWLFACVGLLAAVAGTSLWLADRSNRPAAAQGLAPAALMAASFRDGEGRARSLGEFHGKVVVLNFWATWCAPCREEMPEFERLQARWAERGVRFVGLSAEESTKVSAFARALRITYPLWVGGDEVGEMARRLGDSAGVLPYTVVLSTAGKVVDARVGAYPAGALDALLQQLTPIVAEK